MWWACGILNQGLATRTAWFARWYTQINYSLLREQGEAVRLMVKLIPVETAVGFENGSVSKTLCLGL